MRSLAVQVPFTEQHDYNWYSGYDVTNEEPELYNAMLGARKFNSIGAICSAGEVLFFVLLHRVVESLVAVDHAYKSLAVTYIKLTLLQELGPAGLRDLFVNGSWPKFYETVNNVAKQLPKPLQTLPISTYFNEYNFKTMYRREWHFGSMPRLQKGQRNLNKLALMHGDLSDLSARGPFDLLYTSNIHEHKNRDGNTPTVQKQAELLREGGLLIGCWTNGIEPDFHPLKVVKKIHGFRTTWGYFLLEK